MDIIGASLKGKLSFLKKYVLFRYARLITFFYHQKREIIKYQKNKKLERVQKKEERRREKILLSARKERRQKRKQKEKEVNKQAVLIEKSKQKNRSRNKKGSAYLIRKIWLKLVFVPLKKLIKLPLKILLYPLNKFKKITKTILRKGKRKKVTVQKENIEEGREEEDEEEEEEGDKEINEAKEEPEKEIVEIDKLTKEADPEKNRFIAPGIRSPKRRYSKKEIFNFIKEANLTLRLSKRVAIIFALAIFLGLFSFSIPRTTQPLPIEEERGKELSIGEEEETSEKVVLGEKVEKEEKPVAPLTFKDMVGRAFAIIALFFGGIFFLYSTKYYLTSIIVLIASRAVNNKGKKSIGISSFLYRLLFRKNSLDANGPNGFNATGSVGFLPDIEPGKIKKSPFISVHLPFYNEKRVVNRILTACTSFDYSNYEVIVADDSNDETVEILEKWRNHPRVKILHRKDRSGYKGGALREAVKEMDKRTEFVVVFDADFIPYPDTLKQFLKYFLINGNGLNGNGVNGNGNGKSYKDSNIAAVQGYQWHVLNKNENWVTRSVRSEFAGSYVIERPGRELMGSMKQIAGSVYMIRSDVLRAYNWTNSITEDFELTLRIYRDGWKVIYTPYVQAPAECVSTIKRLIRQRMRWAEGHTSNVRKYFWSILKSRGMSRREKLEFLYLAPYYLQSVFLLVGTAFWFISDILLNVQLPFWTALWGWSLVAVNLFALPFINSIGLFFEESSEKDYLGILSFVALTYIVAPFQALAAIRGLFKKEGGWFRTPKSGHITDLYFRSRYRRWFKSLFPRKKTAKQKRMESRYLKLATSHSRFKDFKVKKRKGARKIANIISLLLLTSTLVLQFFAGGLSKIELGGNTNKAGPQFVSITSPEGQDNNFETGDNVKSLSTVSSVNLPDSIEKIASVKDSKIVGPEEGEIPEKIINLPAPEEPPEDIVDLPPPERPKPREPIKLREDLPEKEKEAVRIAWLDWPEGKDEVELEDLRTATQKKYLTKEGKIRQEVGAGPIHYYDEKKELWQDISYEIKPVEGITITGNDAIKYANKTNYFKTYYKEGSDKDNYLTFTLNGKEVTYSLPEHTELGVVQKNKAEVKNNQITYSEIYPGIDLRYTIGLDSLLEEYIVKSPEALQNLTYVSQEFQTKDVNFVEKKSGVVNFTDKKTGEKLWHFPRPVLYELKDQSERNYDLTRDINKQGSKYLSKKVLGESALEWLNNPDRLYPIVIDDSHVVDYTDTNYYDGYVTYDGSTYATTDNSTTLLFGGDTTPDPDESYRAFIKFDISDFTQASYEQADLYVRSVTAHSGDTTDIKSVDNDPNGRAANLIYSDIGSGTVYVNDTNAFTSVGYELFNLGSTALTDLNNALSADWFGVSFQSSDETTDYADIVSEENATTVYRPRLVGLYDTIHTDTGIYLSGVERNTFFDPKYANYWILVVPGSTRLGTAFYSDDDGATWTEDTADTFTSGLGAISNSVNIWFEEGTGGSDGDVYAVWYYSGDLYFNHGTVGDGAITWDTYQNIGDWTYYNYHGSNVTIATDGICWATGKEQNTNYEIKTVQSDDSNCNSWSETVHSNTITESRTNPDIVPLNNGEVYVAWNEDGDVNGRRWNGSSWDTIDSICSSCVPSATSIQQISMVVDSNYDIHLVFTDAGLDLTYAKYDESAGTWSTPTEIHAGSDYLPVIGMDTNTGEIYGAWTYWPNYYARRIDYIKCDYVSNDCTNAANWTSETNAVTSFYLASGFGFSYKANGRVWVIPQEGLYAIDITQIVIPEAVWFLIPIIAFLPKQIQILFKGRSSSARRKKKKRKKFPSASSIFGFKKKK